MHEMNLQCKGSLLLSLSPRFVEYVKCISKKRRRHIFKSSVCLTSSPSCLTSACNSCGEDWWPKLFFKRKLSFLLHFFLKLTTVSGSVMKCCGLPLSATESWSVLLYKSWLSCLRFGVRGHTDTPSFYPKVLDLCKAHHICWWHCERPVMGTFANMFSPQEVAVPCF